MDAPVTPMYGGGAWLRDGRILCANAEGPLFSFPASGGNRQVIVPLGPNESDSHKPVAIAAHSAVLFPVHTAESIRTIAYWAPYAGRKDVYRVPAGAVHARFSQEIFAVDFAPDGHLFYADENGLWAVAFSPDTAGAKSLQNSLSPAGTMLLRSNQRRGCGRDEHDGNLISRWHQMNPRTRLKTIFSAELPLIFGRKSASESASE
jgi:hypothetical protein